MKPREGYGLKTEYSLSQGLTMVRFPHNDQSSVPDPGETWQHSTREKYSDINAPMVYKQRTVTISYTWGGVIEGMRNEERLFGG